MGIRDYLRGPNSLRDINRAIRRAFATQRGVSPENPRVLVLVGDAAASVRLARALSGVRRFVAGAPVGREAIDAFAAVRVDLVLVDLAKLERGGAETVDALSRRWPGLRVLALGTPEAPDEPPLERASLLGATHTAACPDGARALLEAVRRALES